jgi:GTPase KRas protein
MSVAVYKLVILGGGGVGKSALVIRLVTDNFMEEYDPTIQDNYLKQVDVDEEPAMLDILDTAGQDEYSDMQDQWMREGKGFVLVYSIDDPATFDEIPVFMEKIQRAKEMDKVPLVLVGNKCDLPESERRVTLEQGQALATSFGCSFMECSAKAKINNVELFMQAVREIIKSDKEISGGGEEKKKKGGKKFKCSIL